MHTHPWPRLSRSYFPLLFLLAPLATPGCASRTVKVGEPPATEAPKQETLPLAGELKVQRALLENGLKILLVEDHSSPTFAYQTWFDVGSRDEQPSKTGLAHLFEHMMFKGTKNLKDGEFDRLLEGAGAEGQNAFTSRDYTAYVQELPKSQLELITRLEADRMVNLLVNDAAFKTERDVVQNERRFRNENNPDGLMYQELFGLAFRVHPYRWPVIGYQQDLDSMMAADAVAFYQAHYNPAHATIVVSGDIRPTEVLSLIRKYYGTLPAVPAAPRTEAVEPPPTAPRRKTLRLNIQAEKLLLGYRIPEVTHADTPTLNVLQAVLAGGNSSRLQRALVESGIATSIAAYGMDDRDPSLFVIHCNLQKGKTAAQAEATILRELAALAKTPVSAPELERAKNRLAFDFFDNLGSNSGRARFLGTYETLGGSFELGLQHNERAKQITAEEIQAAVRRYFNPNHRAVILARGRSAS